MPLVTPQLLAQLKKIVADHHTAFVVSAFGTDTVPAEVVERLRAQGLLTAPEGDALDDAYLYGQVMAALEDPDVANWTDDAVKAWLKAHPIPLTPVEHEAAKWARLNGAEWCQGLGNTVSEETGQLLIEADQQLRNTLKDKISEATALNIEARKTVKALKTDLGWATRDWTRNLDRIAITEKHNAMQAGVADGIKRRGGDDARVALRCMPDACPICRKFCIGPDGAPRIYKLSQLGPPGSNVHKKQAEWIPCIGAIHPHCQCQVVRVPAGWGFDETGKMVPGGKFGVEVPDDDAEAAKAFQLEWEHRDALRKARTSDVEMAALLETDAGLEEWDGCMADVLRLVREDPGVRFPVLTDRASAKWGEELAGHMARTLVRMGRLRADGDRYFPEFAKGRALAGKVEFQGLPISLEQGIGEERHWYDPHNGEYGTTVMTAPYGYIRGTEGVDGDHVDVFIGYNPLATHAFIVHQRKKRPDGSFGGFDEDKVVLGASHPDEAKAIYLAHYNDPGFFGGMTALTMGEFKARLKDHVGKKLKGDPIPDNWVYTLPSPDLQKGGTLNDSVSGTATVSVAVEAERGPTSGAGVFVVNDPESGDHGRPVGGAPQLDAYRDALREGQPRTSVIRMDPRVYEFDHDPVLWARPFDFREGTMGAIYDGHRTVDTDTVERQLVQHTLIPRNAVNPGWAAESGRLPDEPVSKSEGAAHKYVSKTGYKGHWVYTYAEQHGGKVVPHHSDPNAVVVKVPHAHAEALHGLKQAHGFSGSVIQGGHYTMLPVTQAELAALEVHGGKPPAKAPTPAPKAVSPAKPSTGTTPATATSQKPAAPLHDVPVVSTPVPTNPKAGWMTGAGQAVTVGGQPGTVQGWDYRGKAVIHTAAGKRVLADWQQVQVQGSKTIPENPVNKLSAGTVRKPTAQQTAYVHEVLAQPIAAAGGKSAKDYANWFHARGHDVYLVGGIIRDLVTLTQPGQEKSHAEVMKAMNDVDYVVSAPPTTLRTAQDALAAGVVKPAYTDMAQKGVLPSSKTVDLAALSSGGVYDAPQKQSDGSSARPSTFDHDLFKDACRRDFTANALYYDVHNDLIVDPSGTGVADARNMVLRKLPGAEWGKNDKLAIRFWKLRARGWTGEPETTKEMVGRAAAEFSSQSGYGMGDFVGRQIAKGPGTPEQCLAQFRKVMEEDGAGHVYAKYIKPAESDILHVIKAVRAKKH